MAKCLLMTIASTLFSLFILFGCSNNNPGEMSTLDDVSALKICKAATAMSMGKDIQIMNAEKTKDPGVYHVFYDRPSDNTRWGQLYKFEGNRIIWASAEEPSDLNHKGRWRIHPLDEKFTYQRTGDIVTITIEYSGSNKDSRQFNIAEIK